jgi:hypothetical protein
MYALEPGDPPSHTNDDRFPLALWEVWICSHLGVPIPELIGPLRQCPCNAFQIDYFGDHFQTCQGKSVSTQVHILLQSDAQLLIKYGNIVLTTTTGRRVRYHLCLLLLVRQAGYIVNLSDFYSYRLIEKLTAFLQLQSAQFDRSQFHFRRTAFLQ